MSGGLMRRLAAEFKAAGSRGAAAELLRDLRSMQRKERFVQAVLQAQDGCPVGVELEARRGQRYALISEEPDGSGKGRVTYFDADGFSGHCVYASPVKALEEAVREGFAARVHGMLDQLAAKPAWAIGMRMGELRDRYNAGALDFEDLCRERAVLVDAMQ